MKIIYSELKKFLPDLDKNPQTLRDDITLIGHFTNFYEEIDGEIVFDLDIKVNRGDCLGYYGLARDLSVYYNIPLVLPQTTFPNNNRESLPIKIKSSDVNRVQAIKLSGIKNLTTPSWLKKILKLHNINSINTLVDLTNYAMLVWSIPNHAFDTAKSGDSLTWGNISKPSEFTTLDGTTLKLSSPQLAISNNKEILSLSFIGGQNSGISDTTKEAIIEMAIYNPSRVRSDWRNLKTVTEAAIRLEKQLDCQTIPLAFGHLINLIQETTQASIASSLFDYYPKPITPSPTTFHLSLPSKVAGIPIPTDFAKDTLLKLGCIIKDKQITPPSIRPDIEAEEDLVEEVVRFWGYQKIATNQPLVIAKVPDITPKIIYLIEAIKDKLVSLGYDEVLTWPLIKEAKSDRSISTQNSINSEVPHLRENIIQSLQTQVDQYQRLKLSDVQIFEIGKAYLYDSSGQPTEHYSLGLYHYDSDQLKKDIATLRLKADITDNYAEVILDNLSKSDNYLPKIINNNAIELTQQLITLDANVNYDSKQKPSELIAQYSSKIDPSILWQIMITDEYHDPSTNKYRYTFRVSYYNCDDKTAKKEHLTMFGFIKKTEKLSTKTDFDKSHETKLLYYQDMYATDFAAQIIDIREIEKNKYLVLDQTLFFPEGGGQPGDTGIIGDAQIVNTIYKNNQVLHHVENISHKIGEKINGKVDWNHRYKYMKIHSAGHLLHEIITTINPKVIPLKGNHHDQAYLVYQGQITESSSDIQKLLNQKIKEGLPIICQYTTYDELVKLSKHVPSNLPRNKPLRLLKIGNYPAMADGGIQVKSTSEIEQVVINKIDYSHNQSTIFYQVINRAG